MALTASGQLSLGDIANEMGVSLSDVSLTSLSTEGVNQSSDEKPDGGDPHAVSEFYGYDHSAAALTAFDVDESIYGNNIEACASGRANATWYHDGAGSYPIINDVVYIDSGGTTNPGDGYFWMNSNSWIFIEAAIVNEAGSCGRSERSLKYNIQFIGNSPMGIPMYHFNYKNPKHG